MEEKKKNNSKKAGIILGLFAAFAATIMIVSNMNIVIDENKDVATWHQVAFIDHLTPLGENDPDGDDSGWAATFCLDYAETPATCLASNATNGTEYSSWTNVSGYIDTDDTDKDLKSEDPFYFVVRCRFNDSVKSGSDFIGSRCRCHLNVTGDETISAVGQRGDITGVTGGGIVSHNDTDDDYIWINFYWDDNSDGYRITDDGTLTWNVTISAKY